MSRKHFRVDKGIKFNPVTAPSDPVNGDTYFDSGSGKFQFRESGLWKGLGGGGGGASGVNFIGLGTTWSLDTEDDRNAETSLGNWVTYNDSAAIPVDLTGGTASQLTLSRTTTSGEAINGSASFKIVKSAANAQGQGASCVLNVPIAYQGKLASVTIPFKVVSGTLVEGDIKCYLYDVTNSQIITPFKNDIIGSYGTLSATFYVNGPANSPANIQMRVGLHFASTSASAVTLVFDDVFVGSKDLVVADAISNTNKDSTFLTANGFGTVTNASYSWRRVGDQLEVIGSHLVGTVSGTTASISLPSGYEIDYTKIKSGAASQHVGIYIREGTGAQIYTFGADYAGQLFVDGSDTTKIFISPTVNSGVFEKLAGNAFSNNNEYHSFNFSVPIVGWSASASVNNSTTFNISNYLANGTRVTTTPAALGEYRSRYRSASSSNTFSDVAPTVSPSSANGMRLHPSNYSAAQTSGDISLWDIYVGKNKTVRVEYYKSSGKTGRVSTDYYIYASDGTSVGVRQSYDPTTGVLTIDAGIASSTSETSRFLGLDNGTDGTAVINDGYFDVIVSENALAITNEKAYSEVWLTGGSGAGSSGTKTRRFTTVKSSKGQAIEYADSATNGASFTIKEAGKYFISYSDADSGGFTNHGITLNSSNLASNVISLADSQILAYAAGANGASAQVTTVADLNIGDIVRAQFNAADNTASYNTVFKICKIG